MGGGLLLRREDELTLRPDRIGGTWSFGWGLACSHQNLAAMTEGGYGDVGDISAAVGMRISAGVRVDAESAHCGVAAPPLVSPLRSRRREGDGLPPLPFSLTSLSWALSKGSARGRTADFSSRR